MCSITLVNHEAAMTTTQFMQTMPDAGCTEWQVEERAQRRELEMNWVVVIDEQGEGRLRMHWTVAEKDVQ